MLRTEYQGSRPRGFRQDFFPIFSLYKSMQNVTPGVTFWATGAKFELTW